MANLSKKCKNFSTIFSFFWFQKNQNVMTTFCAVIPLIKNCRHLWSFDECSNKNTVKNVDEYLSYASIHCLDLFSKQLLFQTHLSSSVKIVLSVFGQFCQHISKNIDSRSNVTMTIKKKKKKYIPKIKANFMLIV